LGNAISALHNIIKPHLKEGPSICKSSGFRVCAFLILKKKEKKEKKAIRQQNSDRASVSNLIHKD